MSSFENPSGSHRGVDHSFVSHHGFHIPVVICNNDNDEGLFNALMELTKGVVEVYEDLSDPFEPLHIWECNVFTAFVIT